MKDMTNQIKTEQNIRNAFKAKLIQALAGRLECKQMEEQISKEALVVETSMFLDCVHMIINN